MILLLALIFFSLANTQSPDVLVGRCSSDSCKNGASCHQVEKWRYLCECETDFYGFQCEYERTDECVRDNKCPPSKDVCGRDRPCVNGYCKNTDNSFHCWCPVGFSGRRCEIEDPHFHCRPEMCDHGHCITEKHEPKCVCEEGWAGDRCDEEMELSYECVDSPCAPMSLCLNTSGSIECVCAMGKTGRRCEFDLNLCTRDKDCQNGGYCVHNTCICREGFEGTSCELEYRDPCMVYDNCIGYQVCVANRSEILGFSCVCPPGYTGQYCDAPIEIEEERPDLSKCYLRKCAELSGNGVCDAECNHLTCGFDGGDCPPGRNCLFDEFEGSGEEPEARVNCTMTEVRLNVLVKPGNFVRKVDDFLSSVSQRLRTWVRIKKSEGELDVFELNSKGKPGPRVRFGSRTDARMEYREKREATKRDRNGVVVFLQIGLSECSKKCHRHLNFAAHSLSDREWREERWREFRSSSVAPKHDELFQ